jgi:GNAT superfamily N-acetyltransferase
MEITIRPAQPGDIPRMTDLLAELFRIESDFNPDVHKQMKGLSLLVADPSDLSLILVAVMNRKIVGMATVQTLVSTAEGGHVGLVEDVVVDRQFRGRGIGGLLLNRIAAWSRMRDLKRLQLLADRNNESALKFYDVLRWKPTSLICLRRYL